MPHSSIPLIVQQGANIVVAEMDFKVTQHQVIIIMLLLRMHMTIDRYLHADTIGGIINHELVMNLLSELINEWKLGDAVRDSAMLESAKQLDKISERVLETVLKGPDIQEIMKEALAGMKKKSL